MNTPPRLPPAVNLEAVLRHAVGDAWHSYLTRLAELGHADFVSVGLLDALIAAAQELREMTNGRFTI